MSPHQSALLQRICCPGRHSLYSKQQFKHELSQLYYQLIKRLIFEFIILTTNTLPGNKGSRFKLQKALKKFVKN